MQTTLKNRPVQRIACIEEQGVSQVIWQVLRVLLRLFYHLYLHSNDHNELHPYMYPPVSRRYKLPGLAVNQTRLYNELIAVPARAVVKFRLPIGLSYPFS